MKLTRRSLVGGAAVLPALAAASAAALPTAPYQQAAGYYRFRLGRFAITVVSDGNLVIPASTIGVNADPEEVRAFLEANYLDPDVNYSHTNHVVVDTGEARVLVDVGSGVRFQPSAGRLLDNLAAADIDPDAISHIALTHAHPDHVWGMLDDFGDEPRFPEASYVMAAAEYDWWMAEDRIDQVPEEMQAFVVGAQNALSPVADRITMAGGETEIVPGVTMIDTPGHTVGHMSVMVESEGEVMLVTGDAIAHAYAHFAHPGWHFGFDTDRAMAAETRARLLDMAATDRLTVAGYHLPFPGIGHVARDGDAYRWIPSLWRWGA